MHKVFVMLKRRPGMSPEAFRAHYEGVHAPLCMKYMAGVDRYVRHYLAPAPGIKEPEYDVITELWFKDKATLDLVLEHAAKDTMPDDVIADEENLFDRARSRFCAVADFETEMPAA